MGELPDFIRPRGGQQGVEILVGQRMTGVGELLQASGQPVTDQRQGQKGHYDCAESDVDALTDRTISRLREEGCADAEAQAAVFDAGKPDCGAGIEYAVGFFAQMPVQRWQGLRPCDARVRDATSILVQQRQIDIGIVAARFIQNLVEAAVFALHQRRCQSGIEQGHGAVDTQSGLVDQFGLGQPQIADHQQSQHQRFDQQAGEREFQPERSVNNLLHFRSALRVSPR